MPTRLSDREIEELYESADYRITQERSDFVLPQIVDFVTGKKWLNLRPEYQRRLVWNNKKKSLLIESLLMNVPIPPVFLYEHDLSRYEVMDGQQRLNTIVEFYSNQFKLAGLEKWTPLNGLRYSDCPPRIQRGLDRRRISSTVLLAESTISSGGSDDLRKLVFERLNTGGQNLNPQELRNCIYAGKFNDLIVELAGTRLFNLVWDIPPYNDNIRGSHVNKALLNNNLYKRMGDCEIVLRFFALRQKSKIRGSMKAILDRCMEDFAEISDDEVAELRQVFISRLELGYKIYGYDLFKIGKPGEKDHKVSVPLYDAVMVALDRLFDRKPELIAAARKIKRKTEAFLGNETNYELIVGRANTAAAVRQRQDAIEAVLRESL